MKSNQQQPKAQSKVLGVGLDGDDGHTRLTRGEDFLLAGGSQETHEAMQETMIKVTEKLGDRGRKIRDTSPEELRDLMHDAQN